MGTLQCCFACDRLEPHPEPTCGGGYRFLTLIKSIFFFFLLRAASIPFFACELKAVSPYRRGFVCGDPSITYPYLHREIIPDELLIAGGIIITGLTIALGECYRVRFRSVSSKAFVRNLYVSCLYKELGSFLFGCCIGQSLTNMAKLSVGRLRPHFLSVCGVTYASLNCTPGTYVATVTCRQPDHRLEEEARKSFFSGHASFAMYTMLYLAFYLQARFTWRGARLLRPALQFFLVLLAFYTGLTRISDYRHHPSDVLTGYIQGALTAYWVVSIPRLLVFVHRCASTCQSLRFSFEAPMETSKHFRCLNINDHFLRIS
uniref:Phosphatidic acid phosphatase type 2D n=1 Tax=Salarias fasciatus TaxID=181472 RepID=A0A672I100_SALFA